MSAEFEQLNKRFHKVKWAKSAINLPHSISSFDFNPMCDFLACGSSTGQLFTLDSSSFDVMTNCTISPTRITDVCFNSIGDTIASTSYQNNDIVLTNLTENNDEDFDKIRCRTTPLCVKFMEDHRTKQTVLLIGNTNGVDLLDLESGAIFRQLEARGGSTNLYTWNGCMIAGGSLERGVKLWDARCKQPIAHFGDNSKGKPVFSVDPSARLLTLADKQGQLELHDIGARKLITKKMVFDEPIRALSFSPSSRLLLTSDAKRLSLINLNEITLAKNHLVRIDIRPPETCKAVKWHPNQCKFFARSSALSLQCFTPKFDDETDSLPSSGAFST